MFLRSIKTPSKVSKEGKVEIVLIMGEIKSLKLQKFVIALEQRNILKKYVTSGNVNYTFGNK